MRILYLSQYFPPENGATQTRAFEMARHFVRMGQQVTVIGEFPNHPSGIIPDSYRGKLYECEDLEGIDVIRVWVKASPVKNFRSRILFYLSYMFSAALAGLFLARGAYDLVYASSPPLFVGGAALVISWLRGFPLVFEVRDLWPESAVALGELNSRRAIAWATRLEEACYHHAQRVVVVTQGIRQRLLDRGLPEEKLLLIPNGANTEHFVYDPQARNRTRFEMNWESKFVVAYTGIFGVAYDFESLFETASRLVDDPDILFVLVGDGPRKADIQNRLPDAPNVRLYPEVPYSQMPALLSASDLMLIPLAYNQLFKGTLPVKMFDGWACQRPVLLCNIPGEASLAIDEAAGGLVVPPASPDETAATIRRLKASPEEAQHMGKKGREYTIEHFSRKKMAERLLEELIRFYGSSQ